jgi:hypothetical protein
MARVTVLMDGPFRIEWNGGHTFNVFALDNEVNVFSGDYGRSYTEEQARTFAHEWWSGEDRAGDSGKQATQEMIQNSDW